MENAKATHKKQFLLIGLCLTIVIMATTPIFIQPYMVIFLTSIFLYMVLTMSWAIFSGPTRYISLASAAFFGTGIYVAAIFGEALPLIAMVLAGGLISFFLAFLIGILTLRLRGMYFIIFTFVSSELIRNFILFYENSYTGTIGRWVVSMDSTTVYYFMLVIFIMTLGVAYAIKRTRFGLALRSIGEAEEASDHIGINVVMMKILAFAISAFFMGASGAIMATRWTYIDPMIAFNPLYSFMPVLMAIFGGIEHIHGHMVGAIIFSVLEELLITEFPYHYMLLFGIILIAAIVFLPQGLVGKWSKGGLKETP